MMVEGLFWLSVLGVGYAYVGYPALLLVLGRLAPRPVSETPDFPLPAVTVIVPVHNEERVIGDRLSNLAALRYPRDRLAVRIVSDGSTDGTRQRVESYRGDLSVHFLELANRQGKAAALNVGLQGVRSPIVVFCDASIMLEPDALERIVAPFGDPAVGCVSGEDHIPGGGGEGWYGRYELALRNLESRVSSIAGASGSFYAVRTGLCSPFVPGLAPDFHSVLVTVRQGFRAITEPRARGFMSSVKNPRGEFQRKVRTLIRGMTALWQARDLLNPRRSGMFALVLWSHKMARWLVPFFLVLIASTNVVLAGDRLYTATGVAQLLFYVAAFLAWLEIGAVRDSLPGRIALYFTVVNAAILLAWVRFVRGVRVEIWEPTQR